MNILVLLVVAAIAVSCNLASAAETLEEACLLAMMPAKAAMEEMKAQGVPDCMQTWMDNEWIPTEFPKSMGDAPAFMEKMQAFMANVFSEEGMKCMQDTFEDMKNKWDPMIEAMTAAYPGACENKANEITGKAMEMQKMAMEMHEMFKNEIW